MAAGLAAIITTLLKAVGQKFAPIRNKFVAIMSSVTALASMWAVHAMYKAAPDIGLGLSRQISEMFYTQPMEWSEFVSGYISKMTGKSIGINDITGAGARPYADVASYEMGKAFFHPMLNTMLPILGREGGEAVIQPEDGVENAQRFLGLNLQFQMSAWLLHLYGDWFSFGSFKSLKDLPNAISWSFGIGWLSWLVMGVPFRMGISDPLERYYNKRLRPTQPSYSQVFDLWHKGFMTEAEVKTALDEMGYSPEWEWRLMAANWKTYSKGEIRDLYESKMIGRADAIEYLQYNDTGPEQAEVILTLWDSKRTYDLIHDITENAEDMYVRDLIGASILRGYLDQEGYSPEQMELKITALDMKRTLKTAPSVDTRDLSPANIGRLFQLGKYSRGRARELLLENNFNPEQVEDYLELYEPKEEKPEEEKEATQSVLGRLFIEGELPEDELTANLQVLGYSSKAIDYLVRDYRLRKEAKVPTPKVKELTASNVGRLYKTGEFDFSEALSRIMDLGYLEEDSRLFLSLYEPPPEEEE